MPFPFEPLSLLVGAAVAALACVVASVVWMRRAVARARADAVATRDAAFDAERRYAGERLADAESLAASLRKELSQARAAQSALVDERARLATRVDQLARLDERLAALQAEHDAERARRHQAEARAGELTARLESAQATAEERRALLQQTEQRLQEAFENLASRILEDKARRFTEHNAQQLGGLLDPLKVQLKDFREAVDRTYADEQRQRGALSKEIDTLRQLNERISQDAINLTRALKGDTQAQGAWGELVLERVLEASGLQSGREYFTQFSLRDEDGGRLRPDVLVRLPDDKDLVIDAKVSLVAYERFCAAGDDAERARCLREHVLSVRRHIDGLSARGYSAHPDVRSLDFVLMFVPVEAAFIEVVRADSGIYAHALGRNIALVSPSTLLATLRTVSHLWKVEQRNINAKDIADRATKLYDNLAQFVGEFEAIGAQLGKAQDLHGRALRRLTQGGRGSIVLQAEKLRELGVHPTKALPAGLLDRAGAGSDEAPAGDNDGGRSDEADAATSPDER